MDYSATTIRVTRSRGWEAPRWLQGMALSLVCDPSHADSCSMPVEVAVLKKMASIAWLLLPRFLKLSVRRVPVATSWGCLSSLAEKPARGRHESPENQPWFPVIWVGHTESRSPLLQRICQECFQVTVASANVLIRTSWETLIKNQLSSPRILNPQQEWEMIMVIVAVSHWVLGEMCYAGVDNEFNHGVRPSVCWKENNCHWKGMSRQIIIHNAEH